MGAAAKARALVERLAAQNGGQMPREVAIALYADAAQFDLHHPGESFTDHLAQRTEIVAWLTARKIKVLDALVTATIPTKPAILAKHASHAIPFRRGDPYNLGLSLGLDLKTHTASIGWWAIKLGSTEGGEE